jgi:hypothetical protein
MHDKLNNFMTDLLLGGAANESITLTLKVNKLLINLADMASQKFGTEKTIVLASMIERIIETQLQASLQGDVAPVSVANEPVKDPFKNAVEGITSKLKINDLSAMTKTLTEKMNALQATMDNVEKAQSEIFLGDKNEKGSGSN